MKTTVNVRAVMEEEVRLEGEIIEWFDRLTAAKESDELERLWEERGPSGKVLLQAFLVKQFDSTVMMTTVLGKLLLRTRRGEVWEGVVLRMLTLFNEISKRQSELAHQLQAPNAEIASRWPYVYCDVRENPDPAPDEVLETAARTPTEGEPFLAEGAEP